MAPKLYLVAKTNPFELAHVLSFNGWYSAKTDQPNERSPKKLDIFALCSMCLERRTSDTVFNNANLQGDCVKRFSGCSTESL